ncbi:MAG: rRNA maturation RNase YbeY [Isosphaeraceae bacterium]|nr:rRNA maturation RNase YbeY [Isosphaeraceae bacterium]
MEQTTLAPAAEMVVDVTDAQTLVPGVDRAEIARLVRRTLAREGVDACEISVFIVDDAAGREINARHLRHDWETDVITFPLSEPDDERLAGELVVSIEMAWKTAASVGVDPWTELALYIIHGLMHLLGYDDQTLEDSDRMREREAFHLRAEGLANSFGLVASAPGTLGREGEPCPA